MFLWESFKQLVCRPRPLCCRFRLGCVTLGAYQCGKMLLKVCYKVKKHQTNGLSMFLRRTCAPKDEFRWKVMGLMGLTLLGTFIWDRFCVFIFAPEIFKAAGVRAMKSQRGFEKDKHRDGVSLLLLFFALLNFSLHWDTPCPSSSTPSPSASPLCRRPWWTLPRRRPSKTTWSLSSSPWARLSQKPKSRLTRWKWKRGWSGDL